MEIFENYNDSLNNAPVFRIYRGIFKSDNERVKFNDTCKNTKDKIMLFLSDDRDNALNKLSNYIELSDSEKQSFLKKILNTKKFLEKKENEYKFNDWIKQIFINLLYGEETFRYIRYSRNLNNYIKGEYYYKILCHLNEGKTPKDIKLYYYTFLFIIDSFNLLDIIEHKIGYYISLSKEGKESRMRLSNIGKSLFSKKENTLFESIQDHELIIKTDRVPIETKRGVKYKIKNIIYNDSVEIRRKKVFIKKINEIYNNTKLTVNANNIIIDNSSFLDELFLYSRNNSLSLSFLNCELRNNISDNDQDRRYTFIKYLDKLNNIDNKLISVSDKRRNEIGNTDEVSLLMLYCDSCNEYARLHLQQSIENGERIKVNGDDFLKIDNIQFEINKKYLFRVFSRNSWLKHGRWYGGLYQQLPKVLRKNIYLNDSNEPLVRLDYKAMHPRLAYHLKGIPYHDDPYIITGYGKEYRDIFKIVALVAINAESEQSAILAISDKLQKEGLAKVNYKETKKFLIAFRKQHREIDNFITSDFGVKAMYYDSNIIADCLSELMIKRGIFILTVHDEILCERHNIEEVKNQMEISYRKVLKKALIERGKEQSLLDELQALIDVE